MGKEFLASKEQQQVINYRIYVHRPAFSYITEDLFGIFGGPGGSFWHFVGARGAL